MFTKKPGSQVTGFAFTLKDVQCPVAHKHILLINLNTYILSHVLYRHSSLVVS